MKNFEKLWRLFWRECWDICIECIGPVISLVQWLRRSRKR